MLEYKALKCGKKIQKLVIFLHGHNGDIEDHQYALDWLQAALLNAVLIVPVGMQVSDKNSLKRQWFGIMKHDPENRRRLPETTAAEIMAIYDKTSAEIATAAREINDFIDAMQQKYGIADAATYVIGFSQGAMLALYAALTRRQAVAGCIMLSGLAAGWSQLAGQISARPPVYLLHGEQDMKVQYKTLPLTAEWLQHHHIAVDIKTYAELAHKMNEAEMRDAAAIINQL